MDQTNSQRFRSLCNDQTDPDEQCKPDLLWISIIDHHQCENNAVIYLYQTRLDQLEQDHNTTRTDHINNFMKIKTEMKNVPLDSATGWHPGTGLSFEKKMVPIPHQTPHGGYWQYFWRVPAVSLAFSHVKSILDALPLFFQSLHHLCHSVQVIKKLSNYCSNPKYNKNYVRNHWTTLHHPPKL
ncbi:hypothetical protein PSHT_15043 [Puccinia striiformis]|uniref:Uncharacterized protein n=1 Tax=Puccinia striiformis TaxID=27350 RepID=A0A2S4UH40_9BASI|nr:hypothetical protein PSHT_15043 [Puccinia striiformis]